MTASSTLNQEEVSALMDAIDSGKVASESAPKRGTVVPYDLTSHDRIVRGQMPALDAINEQVASVFGSALAGRIRVGLTLTSSASMLQKFSDVHSGLAQGATLCVLTLAGTRGQALAILEPKLAELLLAAAMGNRKVSPEAAAAEPRRDLTSVDRLVLKRLLCLFTDALRDAWRPSIDLCPELIRFESDPRMAAIVAPNETAIVTTFEFQGAIVGKLQMVIPFAAVEAEKKTLCSPPRASTSVDETFTAALARELQAVPVELTAVLGKAKVLVSRLSELTVGDVITLDTHEESLLDIRVQGRSKFRGKPRVSGGNIALTIESGDGSDRTAESVNPPAQMAKVRNLAKVG